jgi:hypothetical protein
MMVKKSPRSIVREQSLTACTSGLPGKVRVTPLNTATEPGLTPSSAVKSL